MVPVPAPSSNETMSLKSDDVKIVCKMKSANTSAPLQTWKEQGERFRIMEHESHMNKNDGPWITCNPTLVIIDVILCWIVTPYFVEGSASKLE